MAVERKITAGIDDVKALILECLNKRGDKQCGGRIAFNPVGDKMPDTCPTCGLKWLNTSSEQAMVFAIFGLRNTVPDKSLTKVRVLLEFDERELL